MKKYKNIVANAALMVGTIAVIIASYYVLYKAGEPQAVWVVDTVIGGIIND